MKSSSRRAVLVGLCFALSACGVNEVEIPDLFGPSERAESLVLQASPDALVADGSSFSIIQGIFRDRNGQPIVGRPILFKIADESGNEANIGTLSSDSGKGNTITDSNGIARAIYTSPPRTDATANQTVLIMGRPVGSDFNGESYNYVRIELRSAEPRLFPAVPNNVAPKCGFVVEIPNGLRAPAFVQLNTNASDEDGTIVRYEWYFSDDPTGTPHNSPDTGHVFRLPGTYTVRHVVTDDDGLQSSCTTATPFIVVP